MHWNAQGITNPSSIYQLEHTLNQKKIDIVFINETFLNKKSKFKLHNYNIYRQDRLTHGGGVLIGIKKSIPHQFISSIPTINIENVSIIIFINNRPIRFTSAYSPKYNNSFINDINLITDQISEYFVFGDLNARHTSWNCPNNNTAGNMLYNHQLNSNYYIHYPHSFTRFGQRSSYTQPSVIDLLLTNSNLNISSIDTHPGLLHSDHVPITCQIYGSITETTKLIPMYNRANWREINVFVDTEIQRNNLLSVSLNETNIEQILDKTTYLVQEAAKKVPVKKIQIWQRKLTQRTLFLIGQRNRFTRKCKDRSITEKDNIFHLSYNNSII